MEILTTERRTRSESTSSSSLSSSSRSGSSTKLTSSPRSSFDSLDDTDPPRKNRFDDELLFVGKRRVSARWAVVCLVLVSSIGFRLGRCASSILRLSITPTSVYHQQPQPRSQHGDSEHSLPFMSRYWVDEIRTNSRRRRRTTTRPSRTTRTAEEKLERRKQFAAHAIHPVLLTVLPVPTSIAIAIDRTSNSNPRANFVAGNQLAEDLLSEIVTYRDLNRITILYVDGEDSKLESTGSFECPQSLLDILVESGKEHVDMECSNANTNKGSGSPTRGNHDVSVVLANCDSDSDEFIRERETSTWEEDLYLTTKTVAVKCVGRTYPLDHPARLYKGINSGKSSNIDKIEHFFVPDLRIYPSSDSFLHATDYDVFGEHGVASNFAVAFRSITNGLDRWRLPMANYQVAMHHRWESFANGADTDESSHGTFGAADMLRIQFPSRQSALSSCNYNKHLIVDGEDEEVFCDQGFDPFPNVPADKFYVAKSSQEGAGRGVFPSIDLKTNSYLMAETSAQDVLFSHRGFGIMESMVNHFCLPKKENENRSIKFDAFRCIVGIYYDSYGYGEVPNGRRVNSGINTFINHGCNGSSNMANESEGLTEFTILSDDEDPDPETFEIPVELFDTKLYNPNYERRGHLFCYDMVGEKEIPAHTELLDDYAAMSVNTYFLSQVVSLQQQCSGSTVGTVVNYEQKNGNAHIYDDFGSPYVMDNDAIVYHQLASFRKIADSATDEL